MKLKTALFSLVLAASCLSGLARINAAQLSFQLTDVTGDSLLTPDLASLTMTFDNVTGDYSILLTADPAQPFVGPFRVNVNLYNPDTGTSQDPSFFSDVLNDLDLPAPQSMLLLTGSDPRLLAWQAGHRVAANEFPFGGPDGQPTFRTDVRTIDPAPLAEDGLGPADATNFTTIAHVQAPPTVTLSEPQTVECSSPAGATATVSATLGDINGDGLTVVWSVDGSVVQTDLVPAGGPPTSATVSLTQVFSIAQHLVEVAVTDGVHTAVEASTTVTVGDTHPPVITSVKATPNMLRVPNHKMIPIRVTVVASDECSDVTCRIIQIASSELENGKGDGNTVLDWEITGDLTAKVRAERSGGGMGRIYTIVVECSDAAGNTALDTTTVTVPHDRRKMLRLLKQKQKVPGLIPAAITSGSPAGTGGQTAPGQVNKPETTPPTTPVHPGKPEKPETPVVPSQKPETPPGQAKKP